MTITAAILIGVLLGLTLGALGGGGSVLMFPALVYVLGEPARVATTESLFVVGVTALVATTRHARAKRVNWFSGLVFGLAGTVASYFGTAANRAVAPSVVLLAFSGVLFAAAFAMSVKLRRDARTRSVRRPSALAASRPSRQERPELSDSVEQESASDDLAQEMGASTSAKLGGAGSIVGFLTGFLGVGGGFVIVPALVIFVGYDMVVAVGTSLLVISINSGAALISRAGHETFHWHIILPLTAAAMASSLAGKRMTDSGSTETLTRWFIALLVCVAVYVAVRNVSTFIG